MGSEIDDEESREHDTDECTHWLVSQTSFVRCAVSSTIRKQLCDSIIVVLESV